jgi:hypothetical protein
MIIKLTLFGLFLVLIGVIALSYYSNKEGFDDISNGYLSGLSNDLGSAMNTVSSDASSAMNTVTGNAPVAPIAPAPITPIMNSGASMPIRNDVVPEVSISGTGYNAMNLQERAELLKDIQKLVKNEVLAHRGTTPVMNGVTHKIKDTDSTAQGKEYEESCHKDTDYRCPKNPDGSCPPVPDMSDYIKKDAIPCWGCALDY